MSSNDTILTMENITKTFGPVKALTDVDLSVDRGEIHAICGENGAGKSTLMNVLSGVYPYGSYSGKITFDGKECKYHTINDSEADGIVIIHQELALSPFLSIAENIFIGNEQAKGGVIDWDKTRAEAKKLLDRVGLPEDPDTKVMDIGVGKQQLVEIAKALSKDVKLLILDEPTNHLDMESISWLEGFLSSYQGSVIIVSHDRYFLDKIVTKIVELDNGHSQVYNGNYTYFAQKRAEIRENMMKAYLNQQQEIKHQEEVITKLKQFNREKSIKRAESREKMLSRIERLDKPTEVASEMRITLEPNVLSGEDVLTIEGLSKSFGDNNLFSGIDMDIKRGEHVALIGGNGTGKTTILKMINRLVSKDAGAIILGSRVKIGYYDQEHQVLTMSNTIFDEISDAYPDLSNTRIRNVLAAFLFTGEDVFKRIQDLSGGERGRVSLAKLMLSSANFLILDEPTNHLDITSKEILENAIRNYTGTVLYVSHDRYFINQTATRIIELRDKQLTSYIGNYDYYETHRTYSTDLVSPFTPISGVSDAPAQTAPAVSQAKLSWQESKAEAARQRKKANDLKKLEASIEELENRIAEIDEQFLLPENATNVGLLNDLTKQRNEADTELNELYTKWEELSEED